MIANSQGGKSSSGHTRPEGLFKFREKQGKRSGTAPTAPEEVCRLLGGLQDRGLVVAGGLDGDLLGLLGFRHFEFEADRQEAVG